MNDIEQKVENYKSETEWKGLVYKLGNYLNRGDPREMGKLLQRGVFKDRTIQNKVWTFRNCQQMDNRERELTKRNVKKKASVAIKNKNWRKQTNCIPYFLGEPE